MFNNKLLLLRSAKPCTHIIIPAYKTPPVPGIVGCVLNKYGSFTPNKLRDISVLGVFSFENGIRTLISLYPEHPFNSIKLTRLDTNKSIILTPWGRDYGAETGFFWREDIGKEIRLNIEPQ